MQMIDDIRLRTNRYLGMGGNNIVSHTDVWDVEDSHIRDKWLRIYEQSIWRSICLGVLIFFCTNFFHLDIKYVVKNSRYIK